MIRSPNMGSLYSNSNKYQHAWQNTGKDSVSNSPIGKIFDKDQALWDENVAKNSALWAENSQKAQDMWKGYVPKVMQGTKAMVNRQGEKSMASGLANMAASGIANTSMVGGIQNRFMEETGMPTLSSAYSNAHATSTAGGVDALKWGTGGQSDALKWGTGGMSDAMMREASWRASLNDGGKTPGAGGTMSKMGANQPTAKTASTPQMKIPSLNLRGGGGGDPNAGKTPAQFSQAYMGNPNVQNADGKNIGVRTTGTYNLDGSMAESYATPGRAAINNPPNAESSWVDAQGKRHVFKG